MQNADAQLRDMEREHEESRQWTAFSQQQRKLRNIEADRGKL